MRQRGERESEKGMKQRKAKRRIQSIYGERRRYV
jgi:hypothetical protein